MKIASNNKMKLTGNLNALENSIRIYREALTFIIPIVDAHWDDLRVFRYTKQRMTYTEKLIHSTNENQARYDFDEGFPKFPTYLRRAALNDAIGNVDLNASYNIGARYFIRYLLKTVTVTQRLALEAKVPQVAKRSTCTLSHLINLRNELAILTARTQV